MRTYFSFSRKGYCSFFPLEHLFSVDMTVTTPLVPLTDHSYLNAKWKPLLDLRLTDLFVSAMYAHFAFRRIFNCFVSLQFSVTWHSLGPVCQVN